jgi:hypothetical protein
MAKVMLAALIGSPPVLIFDALKGACRDVTTADLNPLERHRA